MMTRRARNRTIGPLQRRVSHRTAKRFDSPDKAIAYAESWNDKRDTLAFEADGMVIRSTISTCSGIGVVGKTRARSR
jgi:NAD-dependent DNA ligase